MAVEHKLPPAQRQVLTALTNEFSGPDAIVKRAGIRTISPRQTAARYCADLVKLRLAEKGGRRDGGLQRRARRRNLQATGHSNATPRPCSRPCHGREGRPGYAAWWRPVGNCGLEAKLVSRRRPRPRRTSIQATAAPRTCSCRQTQGCWARLSADPWWSAPSASGRPGGGSAMGSGHVPRKLARVRAKCSCRSSVRRFCPHMGLLLE
jgi:hypothetical protein